MPRQLPFEYPVYEVGAVADGFGAATIQIVVSDAEGFLAPHMDGLLSAFRALVADTSGIASATATRFDETSTPIV